MIHACTAGGVSGRVTCRPAVALTGTCRAMSRIGTVARLLRQEPRPLMSHELVEVTGLEHQEVVGALTNLGHRHLDVRDASSEGVRDNYVVGIMPAGLEAVGQ